MKVEKDKTWTFWSFPIPIHAVIGEVACHVKENDICVTSNARGWKKRKNSISGRAVANN
jgi:hypothetical protein